MPRNVVLHHLREALNRDAVIFSNLSHQAGGFGLSHAEMRGVSFGKGGFPGCGDGLAIFLPRGPVHLKIGFFERNEVAAHVEIMLKAGDVTLFPVVALKLVQNLHEHFQDRRRVIPTDAVELLIDVEQDTPRGNGGGLPQIGFHDLIFDLGQNDLGRTNSVGEGLTIEDEGEDLEQM
ncbi:MAG: hypothetical protein JW395_3366 [Nitrospira sp.]|nr:hypothetical protein [Nitrospira sp.]